MDRLLFVVVVAFVCIYGIESVRVKDRTVIRSNTGGPCKTLDCGKPKNCSYGRIKRFGCNTCICNEPCSPQRQPMVCTENQSCVVEENSDGTFKGICAAQTTKKVTDNKTAPSPTTKPTTRKSVTTTAAKAKASTTKKSSGR